MSQDLKLLVEKIHDRQDKMADDIGDIKQILGRQEGILEDHVRRSLANEKAVELLKQSLGPLQTHKSLVEYTVKVVMWLIGSGALVLIGQALLK